MSRTKGPWKYELHQRKRNGYEDWNTYTVRQAETNVCLAVVNEVDRFYEKDSRGNAIAISLVPEMIDAMQDFCVLVERGRIRSVRTYSIFKEILNRIDDETRPD
jgi:hypothetical protein